MKKYRVTRKGKIVFGAVIILLILSFYYFLSGNGEREESLINDRNEVIEIETADTAEENISENHDDSEENNEKEDVTLLPVYSEEEMKTLQEVCFTVFYDPNEYYVPKGSLDKLVRFLEISKKYTEEYIIVEGNANLSGEKIYTDWEKGKNAGYDRALVIKNYLVDNGIGEDRITIINNGVDKPLNIDLSKESLKLNRRSDVFFSNYYCEINGDSK